MEGDRVTSTASWWLLALILALGVFLRCDLLDGPLIQPHLFRQSHTASEIDFYVRDGLSSITNRYCKSDPDDRQSLYPDVPGYRLFEFPLYQHVVTLVCWSTGWSTVLSGRLVNLALYLCLCAIVWWLMRQVGTPALVRLLTLACISTSPLHIYYSQALISDNLAVFLATTSLASFAVTVASPSRGLFALFVVTGVLSALIKSPCFLPVVVAVAYWQ